MSEDKKPENEKPKTVISALTDYLKMRQGRKKQKKKKIKAETWVLGWLRIFIEKKLPNIKVTEITAEDYERFFKWLSDSVGSSPEALKSYTTRLKGFQRYIELCGGIPQFKVKKNNPKNPQLRILELEEELVKTGDDLTKKDEELRLRWETIENQSIDIKKKEDLIETLTQKDDRKKEEECSQCPKKATFDKEREGYKTKILEQQYILDHCGGIEGVKQLIHQNEQFQAEEVQMKEERAKVTEIKKNERFVRVPCPKTGGRVFFGNDCYHCPDNPSCGEFAELTRA